MGGTVSVAQQYKQLQTDINTIFQNKGGVDGVLGQKDLETQLENYALKADIPTFDPANFATKGDLAASEKTYQPAGDYAFKKDLASYLLKSEFQARNVSQDLSKYALASDLAKYQPVGSYALQSDLKKYQPVDNYALTSDLAKYQPAGSYALASDLAKYQPIGNYVLRSEVPVPTNIATKTELSSYSTKTDLDNIVASQFSPVRPRNTLNKCLDVENASVSNDAKVQLWDCHYGKNQQVMYNHGSKQLILQHSGKCMDVAGGVDANGTQIQQYDCQRDNMNQKFTYDGSIQSYRWAQNTNRCIDLSSNGRTNGTKVQLWDCNTGDAQRFV
jgi:hypothetical protein